MFKRISVYFFLVILLSIMAAGYPASHVFAQSFVQIDQGPERIISFASSITVNKDSSILVTEDITVYADGQTIRHGIYRDFPTTYKDNLGNRYVVGFKVISVKKNGLPEQYSISPLSNGKRIYIGDPNVLLNPGIYTYSVNYQVTREIGFFSDHDELYWNVTGNGWGYSIERAFANVTLPDSINLQDVKTIAYTGFAGSEEKAYTSSISQGKIYFTSTRTLLPDEGLTIAVSWPKGFVTHPTKQQETVYWLQDNAGLFSGLAGVLIILLYYLFIWNRHGRDPEKETIIAQYEPPQNITPSEARYLSKEGFDNKCIASDIIDLAVKGYLSIKDEADSYTLTITNKKFDDNLVFGSEKVLLESLFETSDSVKVGGDSNAMVSRKSKLLKWLEDNYEKNYFTNNTKYLIIGLVLSVISIIVSAIISGDQTVMVVCFMAVWLSVWTFVVVGMITKIISSWFSARSVLLLLFMLPFLIGELFAVFMVYSTVSSQFLVVLILLIAMNATFYFLLKQYTVLGLRTVEQLKGFKLFLSVTEKDRMNFANPPERTPELFEKYLPYALALGVVNEWAEQFSGVFVDKDMANTHPLWYTSSIYGSSFVSGFSNSFSSSISASATPPSSTSGFGGGGGFSGGGGGGGGGGGW